MSKIVAVSGPFYSFDVVDALSAFSRACDRLNRLSYQKGPRSSPKLLSTDEGNARIAALIAEGQPALVGRIGRNEQAVLRRMLLVRAHVRPANVKWVGPSLRRSLRVQAGVFPESDETLVDFMDEYLRALETTDVVAVWRNIGDSRILNLASSAKAVIPLRPLHPFFLDDPWTAQLRAKKVLVVHPFSKTFRSQVRHLNKVWPEQVIPPADYRFVTAPQTIGGYSMKDRWIDELTATKRLIEKAYADVVLVGAGAYGLPLAAAAKEAGSVAIVVGGILQMFFGVRGSRWDDSPEFGPLYDAYWVRPAPSERPRGADAVEGACYW